MPDRSRRQSVMLATLVTTLIAVPVRAHAEGPGPLTGLVDAAAQRLQTAEAVAAFKWKTHGAIEDPVRVRQELNQLGADADAHHIDPGYVTRTFSDQINATTAVEYRRFSDWTFDPSSVPAAPPDLSASRTTIDGLNQTMLTQIASDSELLHSPACRPQLDAARADVTRNRQLDGLYQQALSVATQSFCA